MIQRTEGLVLRTHRMTESSLVVVAYTRDLGKVRLAAKGARRPKSRFGASLQPLTRSHLVYYHKDGRDLQTLSEADIVENFDALKRDYDRLAFASVVCELLDHMTVEDDRSPLLYEIACETLSWMAVLPPGHVEVALWYFQLRASGELGYRPHLTGCVVSGSRLTGPRAWFSASLGGTTDQETPGPGVWLDAASLGFLAHLQTAHIEKIDAARVEQVDAVAVRRAFRAFLVHHIESGRQFKAAAFLDRLIAARPGVPLGGRPDYSVAAERPPSYDTPSGRMPQ